MSPSISTVALICILSALLVVAPPAAEAARWNAMHDMTAASTGGKAMHDMAAASTGGKAKHDIPAVFAFGDSTLDPGNNNRLVTMVRSDHPPYGRGFPGGAPTGRFSDGKLITD